MYKGWIGKLGFAHNFRTRRTPTHAKDKNVSYKQQPNSYFCADLLFNWLIKGTEGLAVRGWTYDWRKTEGESSVNVCACSCPYKHSCVCPSPFACAEPCACVWVTLDQNRSLTAAELLLADPCLEEVTAARPVSHWACPAVLHSH